MESVDLKGYLIDIKNGKESSFRAFYDYYYPRFYRIAHYYVKKDHLAEEVVLDVFSKLWQNRKKLPEIKNFRNYGFTMVKNQAINYLNRNKVDLHEIDEYAESKMIEYVEPEKIYLGRELARELEKAICKLPPKCQLIFRMVREDGLKYKEVAETLDISLKAVENQLSIAMKRIKPVLETYVQGKSRRLKPGSMHDTILSLLFCL